MPPSGTRMVSILGGAAIAFDAIIATATSAVTESRRAAIIWFLIGVNLDPSGRARNNGGISFWRPVSQRVLSRGRDPLDTTVDRFAKQALRHPSGSAKPAPKSRRERSRADRRGSRHNGLAAHRRQGTTSGKPC